AARGGAGAARRLVIAGDLFEDGCSEALAADLLAWADRVGLELAGVVPGNHDRGLGRHGGRLPVWAEGVGLGTWRVVHGDGPLPAGRVVQGHIHPCLRLARHLAAGCYLVTADRLVLPAFCEEARGVNVLGRPDWAAYRCCAVAGQRVLDLGELRELKRSRLRPGGAGAGGR